MKKLIIATLLTIVLCISIALPASAYTRVLFTWTQHGSGVSAPVTIAAPIAEIVSFSCTGPGHATVQQINAVTHIVLWTARIHCNGTGATKVIWVAAPLHIRFLVQEHNRATLTLAVAVHGGVII